MTKHAKSVLVRPLGQADPWDGESMGRALAAYASWVDGLWEVQDESLRFCRDFLARSIEAADQISASTSAADAVDVQMRYADEVMRDSFDEGTRMLDITWRAAFRALGEPLPTEGLQDGTRPVRP